MKKTWNNNLDWKKIDQIRYYLIEKTNQNELISKKHKRVLNYVDYSVIAISLS